MVSRGQHELSGQQLFWQEQENGVFVGLTDYDTLIKVNGNGQITDKKELRKPSRQHKKFDLKTLEKDQIVYSPELGYLKFVEYKQNEDKQMTVVELIPTKQ